MKGASICLEVALIVKCLISSFILFFIFLKLKDNFNFFINQNIKFSIIIKKDKQIHYFTIRYYYLFIYF